MANFEGPKPGRKAASPAPVSTADGRSPLNARGAVAQAKAIGDRLNARAGPPLQPKAVRSNGLPDPLRTSMEALSGIALDDVTVHRNSEKPAQMQAHAYAQGTDIHLAPGQEKHLPHEAWHVVQQKQGRVKATGEVQRVAINDDPALEGEADRMGSRAAAAPTTATLQPAVPSSRETLQRVERVHEYNDGSTLGAKVKGELAKIADALKDAVTFAVGVLKGDPALTSVNLASGYLEAWRRAFTDLTTNAQLPPFFYARYGYAVETLAANKLGDSHNGYTIETQVAAGATRPDFVVYKVKGKDLAWLDITSSASIGHIQLKQHSGWTTRPYVAEILYDPPATSDFSSGGLSEEQKAALTKIDANAAQAEVDYQAGEDALAIMIGNAIDKKFGDKGSALSAKDQKQAMHEALKLPFPNITGTLAGEIVRNITNIVAGGVDSPGPSWARAFDSSQAKKDGHNAIINYGKALRAKKSTEKGSASEDTEMKENH